MHTVSSPYSIHPMQIHSKPEPNPNPQNFAMNKKEERNNKKVYIAKVIATAAARPIPKALGTSVPLPLLAAVFTSPSTSSGV